MSSRLPSPETRQHADSIDWLICTMLKDSFDQAVNKGLTQSRKKGPAGGQSNTSIEGSKLDK